MRMVVDEESCTQEENVVSQQFLSTVGYVSHGKMVNGKLLSAFALGS